MLDGGAGSGATPEVLRRIVARQRQQRARRHRAVATTAVVVTLACAGLGVHLEQRSGTTSALNFPLTTQPSSSGQPPVGLKWTVAQTGHSSSIVDPTTFGAAADTSSSSSPALPGPGQFGFSAAIGGGSVSYGILEPSVPAASPAPQSPGPCAGKVCGIVFRWEQPHSLFTRHVDGLTLSVSLLTYEYPTTIGSTGSTGTGSTGTGSTGTGSTGTGSTGTSSTGTSVIAPTPPRVPISPPGTAVPAAVSSPPNAVTKSAVPVTTTCVVESELLVTVSYGSTTRLLFVPVGGASEHPFSVVASDGTSLGRAGSVVVAVARTSPSVSSVSVAVPGAGSDAMAPKHGWAVLAQRLPAGTSLSRAGAVTLVAMSSKGAVLETAHLPRLGALAVAPLMAACHYLAVPVNAASPPPTVSKGKPGFAPGSSGSAAAKPSA
jgi:hypothetical protein